MLCQKYYICPSYFCPWSNIYIDMEILDGKAHQATGLPTFSKNLYCQNANRKWWDEVEHPTVFPEGETEVQGAGHRLRPRKEGSYHSPGVSQSQKRGSCPVVILLTMEPGWGVGAFATGKSSDLESALLCFIPKY